MNLLKSRKKHVSISINFDKPVFYVDEELNGWVDLSTKEMMHMLCFEAVLIGREVVNFTSSKDITYNTEKMIYKELQVIANPPKPNSSETNSSDSPPNGEIIHPGNYQYPLQFRIPYWAPASVNIYNIGMIEWSVKAIFKGKRVKSKSNDSIETFEQNCIITVKKHWPKGMVEADPIGVNRLNLKFPLAKGSMSYTITLDRKVLIKGQNATITVNVNNGSSRKIHEMIVYLKKTICVRCNGGEKQITKSYIGKRNYKNCFVDAHTSKVHVLVWPVPVDLDNSVVYGGREVITEAVEEEDKKLRQQYPCLFKRDGEMISILYFLKIRFKLSLAKDPSEKLSCFVYDQYVPYQPEKMIISDGIRKSGSLRVKDLKKENRKSTSSLRLRKYKNSRSLTSLLDP